MCNREAAPAERSESDPRNRLLAALPAEDLLSFRPHLEPVLISRGGVLFDSGEPLTRVYFVESGVVSLVTVLESRPSAGVAIVGREGFIGVAALLGSDTALGRHVPLVSGSLLGLELSRLRRALRTTPKLRAACEAYGQAFFMQVLHAAACNRLHTVEQRCARWLLMCSDRIQDEAFELTEESLGDMLGVRRSTVTVVAHALQHANLICCRRGGITVLDRRGLEKVTCECYRIVRNRYERLLPRPFA